MNESKLMLFSNEEFGEIRTLLIDGEPWFVGKDVASTLGYRDHTDALKRHVDFEDKLSRCFTDSGQSRTMVIVNESGLYCLILKSKLPSAKKFKHWVTSEVLPSIRKHGAYMTAETLYKTMSEPRELAKLLNALADEKDKNRKLTADNAMLSVKAKYYDKILASPDAIPVTFIAKDYGMSAAAFNRMLYNYNIQFPLRRSWCLYQEYADKGYTQTKTFEYAENHVRVHTCWTQKGRLFLYEFLKSNGILPLCERNG